MESTSNAVMPAMMMSVASAQASPTPAAKASAKAAKAAILQRTKRVKYAAMAVLVAQNWGLIQVMRYSRTVVGPQYAGSTAVVMMELVKLVVCAALVLLDPRYPVKANWSILLRGTIYAPYQVFRLCVPSVLYVIQNNLQYVALSNLDATVYQALAQLKILTTAVFFVLLLRKRLTPAQWVSLVLLMGAVALIQASNTSQKEGDNHLVGFLAILGRSICAGFAGVYFEMVLKSKSKDGSASPSVWIRNLQMGMPSVIFALASVFTKDREQVLRDGFFYGYSWVVVAVILLQALGGLAVALVIKYMDNILKNFGNSWAMLLSLAYEMTFLGLQPSWQFFVGAGVVNLSTWMYARMAPTSVTGSTPAITLEHLAKDKSDPAEVMTQRLLKKDSQSSSMAVDEAFRDPGGASEAERALF